jgi:hypothetical protein
MPLFEKVACLLAKKEIAVTRVCQIKALKISDIS